MTDEPSLQMLLNLLEESCAIKEVCERDMKTASLWARPSLKSRKKGADEDKCMRQELRDCCIAEKAGAAWEKRKQKEK